MKKISLALIGLGIMTFAGFKVMESCKWEIPGNELKISFMALIIMIGVVNLVVSVFDTIMKKA